jgi:hypothetical protein
MTAGHGIVAALKAYPRRKPTNPGAIAECRLLADWQDHPDAEPIWRDIIQPDAPDLTAVGLIRQVIRARPSAVVAVAHVFGTPDVPGVCSELEAATPGLKKWFASVLATRDPLYVADELERAARDIRFRLLHGVPDQMMLPLGDKGSNEARARRAFEESMCAFFEKHTTRGLKLYEAVAFLSNIAFPGSPIDLQSIIRRHRRQR